MRQPWCRWQRRYEGGCCASAFGSGRLVSHHVAEPMCAAGTALACSAALCSAARPPAECLPWRQRTCVWMPVLQLQNRPWLVVVSWQPPTAASPRLSRTVLGKSARSQHHRRQVVGLIRLAECVAVRGCLLQVLRGADELLSRAGSLVDTHQCIDDVAVAQAFPTLTTALRLPAQRQKPRRWSHQCLRHARRSKHTVCRPHNVPQHCGKHSCTTTRWCACQHRACIAAVRGNANHGVAMRAQCNGGASRSSACYAVTPACWARFKRSPPVPPPLPTQPGSATPISWLSPRSRSGEAGAATPQRQRRWVPPATTPAPRQQQRRTWRYAPLIVALAATLAGSLTCAWLPTSPTHTHTGASTAAPCIQGVVRVAAPAPGCRQDRRHRSAREGCRAGRRGRRSHCRGGSG